MDIHILSYKSIRYEKDPIRKSLEALEQLHVYSHEGISYLNLSLFTQDDLKHSVATMGWQKPGHLSG